MGIGIKEIHTKSDLKKFVQFKLDLYKNDPYNVPDLFDDELNTLDREKNPAFAFCEAAYFLAYNKDKIVGRVAAIINHKANEIWEQEYVRFSFLDFVDDKAVSKALMDRVESWAKERGKTAVHGPLGFTDMDQLGLLVKGFDQVSTMATSYNREYYMNHITKLGYEKDQDWNEFRINIPEEIPARLRRVSEIVLQKTGLKIRKFKKTKEILPYANKIFELWNEAYRPLYGYSPLSEKQIAHYVKMYIPMLRLELVTLIVNENDDVIGIGITLPSLAEAMQKANGSLFPFGWIHLLKALRGKNEVVDLYIMGVHPDYQSKGVNALLFYDLIPIYNRLGYKYAESNPELEINHKMHSQWDDFDVKQHKTRRAYIKRLN